jgi:ParB-like chromosome segregation protein Spo0J
MKKIACQIADLTDMEAFEISIVENVQRKTLVQLMKREHSRNTFVIMDGEVFQNLLQN